MGVAIQYFPQGVSTWFLEGWWKARLLKYQGFSRSRSLVFATPFAWADWTSTAICLHGRQKGRRHPRILHSLLHTGWPQLRAVNWRSWEKREQCCCEMSHSFVWFQYKPGATERRVQCTKHITLTCPANTEPVLVNKSRQSTSWLGEPEVIAGWCCGVLEERCAQGRPYRAKFSSSQHYQSFTFTSSKIDWNSLKICILKNGKGKENVQFL